MPIESSFWGEIDEIPFIHVDNFMGHRKKAYFLSHYHADHTVGLAPSFSYVLKKNNAYLYASEVTIAIIKAEIPDLEPYLKVLNLGKNTVTVQIDGDDVYLNIITVPAGHCFGSIMFVFEYESKYIMYTGDFRISRNDVSKYSFLHKSNNEPLPLQAMYVDTTFQDASGFPKRSEVATNIVMHIKNWLNRCNDHDVVLFTSANYGYESIFNEIFNVTGEKTYIEDKWKIYSQFPKELYGISNNRSQSRISTYSKNSEKYLKISKNTLKIYLSAWKWQHRVTEEDFFRISMEKHEIHACFATHNGKEDLVYFVNYFQPKKVVGFREAYTGLITEDSISSNIGDNCNKSDVVTRKRKVNHESNKGKKAAKSVLEKAFDW